jgi:Cell wall-active antibiotics response 4TMS YvqF
LPSLPAVGSGSVQGHAFDHLFVASTLASVRLLRGIGLAFIGFWAGLMVAAATMKRVLRSRGDAESDEVALVAILDGIDLESRASAFRGGSMLAWFGGISVDLRAATLSPDGAHLDLHALNGGIAIKVPEGWRVRSSMRAVFGGVDTRVPEPDAANAPTLTLDGFAAFGGVAVTAKPAVAE